MDSAPAMVYQVLCDAFPGAELERPRTFLSENAVVRRYEPDEAVAFEGEEAFGIGFVLSGTVLALAQSENGREVVVSTTRSGEPLHDVAWYDVGPLPLTLRAHDARGEVLLVERAAVLRCLHQHPAFRVSLLAAVAGARRALLDRLRELSFYEVRSRVARRLLEIEGTGERVHIRRLAVATATVPDVAGRTVRQLRREGVIALDRGIPRIVDRRALHEAANFSGRFRRPDDVIFLRKDAS